MEPGRITVVEGKDTLQTVLSLQFVYRGSTVCGEYGCFISGAKPLEEIECLMSRYGMSSEWMKDSPSIVMLDAGKLKEISSNNGNSFQLEMVLVLLKEIYRDVQFARLAIDRFDLLCEDNTGIEVFFSFVRSHKINMLVTVGVGQRDDLLELCDNYFLIKRGKLPLILFS